MGVLCTSTPLVLPDSSTMHSYYGVLCTSMAKKDLDMEEEDLYYSSESVGNVSKIARKDETLSSKKIASAIYEKRYFYDEWAFLAFSCLQPTTQQMFGLYSEQLRRWQLSMRGRYVL